MDWLIWIFFEQATQYPVTPRIIQESVEEPRADFVIGTQGTPKHNVMGHKLAFVPKCDVGYSVVSIPPQLTVKELPDDGSFRTEYGGSK